MYHLQKILSRSVVFSLLTFGGSPVVWGTTYTGTITETVTATTSPSFYVGEVRQGYYQYDSPTVDGDFGTTVIYTALTNPDALPTLRGSVFAFFVSPGETGFITLGYPPMGATFPDRRHLKVSGGEVTDFYAEGQYGSLDYLFSGFVFGSHYFELGTHPEVSGTTSGTLIFSAPVPMPVPDSSLGMAGSVAFSILGLVLLHRWRSLRFERNDAGGPR